MLEKLVAVLNLEVGLSTEEVADVLWLASIRQRHSRSLNNQASVSTPEVSQNDYLKESAESPISLNYLKPQVEVKRSFQAGICSENAPNKDVASNLDLDLDLYKKPFKFPGAPAFRDPLRLMKALRPLLQVNAVSSSSVFDEAATVRRIVDEGIWMPVFKDVTEPWLDLAFVVEERSASMLIWRQTILELRHFLKNYGLFRDVRTWGLVTDDRGFVRVRSGFGTKINNRTLNSSRELLEPEGRRLILLISDCISPIWHTGQILPVLDEWANHGPMALVQMLPEWLWDRTALRQASSIFLKGLQPGMSNQKLSVIHRFTGRDALVEPKSEKIPPHSVQIKMPILTLEPHLATAWSRMISGRGGVLSAGFLFDHSFVKRSQEVESLDVNKSTKQLNAKEQVERFWLTASSTAWSLAGLLAASPTISLPVVRLIQEILLPESRQVHVAEVLLGGLLRPTDGESIRAETDPDAVTYEFVDPEIRSLLLESSSVKDTVSLLSQYIQHHFGRPLKSFIADLEGLLNSDEKDLEDSVRPFAIVTSEVLKRMGGRYRNFVSQIEQRFTSPQSEHKPIEVDFSSLETLEYTTAQLSTHLNWPPPLQTEEYTVATIAFDSETLSQASIELEQFAFKVGYLVNLGNGWVVQKSDGQAYRYLERISGDIEIEMVAINGGEFMMGSPAKEIERYDDESPQHLVTVRDFYMGRYPVTQAQWRAVAAMPQVERELELDPSNFKGDHRPVEKVSWEEAIEFCARLSAYTNRLYRLPTEAEWEYACRAGTTTPFHFGENISTELANYNGIAYADGNAGESRGETTPVDHFEITNIWGLCDMHGNVREWCQDRWHNNYEGAPEDGSAWMSEDSENIRYVFRGGSWYDSPRFCRSAFRLNDPDVRYHFLGFRLACSAPELL